MWCGVWVCVCVYPGTELSPFVYDSPFPRSISKLCINSPALEQTSATSLMAEAHALLGSFVPGCLGRS